MYGEAIRNTIVVVVDKFRVLCDLNTSGKPNHEKQMKSSERGFTYTNAQEMYTEFKITVGHQPNLARCPALFLSKESCKQGVIGF